jgi:excisionase family DNA binding protein
MTRYGGSTGGTSVVESKRYLRIAETATRLGVGERMVRRLVAERRIPFARVGRYIVFDPADVDSWIAGSKVNPVAK